MKIGFPLRTLLIIGQLLHFSCKNEERAKKEDRAPSQVISTTKSEPAERLALIDEKEVITVCVADAEGYPFSYKDGDQSKGIHIDIAREAITNAGFQVSFKFLPWKRCIEHEMRHGTSNAALSAAWNQTREEYLWYPDDARELGPLCKSPSALICNGPVLLVPAAESFVYDGDPKKIPEPIRVTSGYNQAKMFADLGKRVDEGLGDEFNFGKMVRDGTGSVLIWKLNLSRFESDPNLRKKFKVVSGYEDLTDGFLPFSKAGRFSQQDAKLVWSELKRLRANPNYLNEILAKYPPNGAPKP